MYKLNSAWKKIFLGETKILENEKFM